MKKRLVPLLLALSLLASCSAGAVERVPDAPADVDFPAAPAPEDGSYAAFAAFAAQLLRHSREEGENTLLSPLSAALALGMTANGAQGETLRELEGVLGMDLDKLNSLCAQLSLSCRELGGSTESAIANSLWCDPRLEVDSLFAARCRQLYGAELFTAKLSSQATVGAVNAWVGEITRGLIPRTVDRFSPDSVLALVNAVYLKNSFASPFETPTGEWRMDFANADGSLSHPRGMSNGTRRELYLSGEKGQGVVLPYDDGQLGLLLLLPGEGVSLTDYLALWDGSTLSRLLSGREERLVSLSVPRYELEWGGSLLPALQAMGLDAALDPGRADFSAMGSAGGPIYLGDVIQKSVLKVNEKGTEAAAVTAVVMEAGCAMPEADPIVLSFDRPFVCGIVDLDTGAPLFFGTVEQLP